MIFLRVLDILVYLLLFIIAGFLVLIGLDEGEWPEISIGSILIVLTIIRFYFITVQM